MINITEEKNCCGCAACSIVCPKECIEMFEGTLGHLFPKVDKEKCVDCGLCQMVCPISNSRKEFNIYPQSAYAAYAKNKDIRFKGSSGGMFGVFAKNLIGNGYIVYGAGFDASLKLNCMEANNLEELEPLYKSKYLQSNLSNKYKNIKSQLDQGKKVFFVSTPCQVNALKLYLRKEYKNLLTTDFFCHGVPSQHFFDECLAYEEQKRKGKVKNYVFRSKSRFGSTPHYFTEIIKTGGKDKSLTDFYFKSPFYAFFQKYINLRESCYNCRFAGRLRASDITIGDFHEIDKYAKGINRFDGVSTVIINSSKGKELWHKCLGDVVSIDMNIDELINDGICFGNGTARPIVRDEFLKDYSELNIEQLIKKWVNPNRYWKHNVYYHLPAFVRKKLKNIIGAFL